WLEDITRDEWDGARRGEIDLVFYLTRAAWPHLKARGGVVVNMASLNASLSFKILPSLAHTTNKAGIIGMTRQLALEGRAHGIRANSISPGLIESNATLAQLNDPEWAREMVGKTLLGRLGRPEEVANVALFLASDDSSYVTGVDIVVDGGMKVWGRMNDQEKVAMAREYFTRADQGRPDLLELLHEDAEIYFPQL